MLSFLKKEWSREGSLAPGSFRETAITKATQNVSTRKDLRVQTCHFMDEETGLESGNHLAKES